MEFAFQDWVSIAAEFAVSVIDAMALLLIAIGTVEMFFACVRAIFWPSATGRELRDAYLRYARWLMAGLTFQLAMDIIESARAPTWDDIGRLASIAVIRTFLNYFLERDIVEAARFQMGPEEVAPPRPD